MHTTPWRAAALTAASALLFAVPVSATAAPAAKASGRSWTTIVTWQGAKQQACKVSANDGDAWKIYNRVVNGNKAKVGVSMRVLKNDEATKRIWDSGLVAKRHTSRVGTVLLPRGNSAYGLLSTQYEGQMGDGMPIGVGHIGHC